MTKPKIYKVSIRTNEVKLNCSFISNPSPAITWFFSPQMTNDQKNRENEDFSLHLIDSLSSNLDSNDLNKTLILKSSFSKHHIFEKLTNHNQINSILSIKV